MQEALQDLLAAVKDAARSGIWSQGVKLARDDRVVGDTHRDTEISFRVRGGGTGAVPRVTLYPHDEEWDCDCGGPVDPCAHIVAAVIAATRPEGAQALFAKASARLHYALEARNGGLWVRRLVVSGSGEKALSRSLDGAAPPDGLTPTEEDVFLDRVLGGRADGALPPGRARELLAALTSAHKLTLGGEVMTAHPEPLGAAARLRKTKTGHELVIDKDARIDEVVAVGMVRAGSQLHPIGDEDLCGSLLEKLPVRQTFRPADQAKLFGEVLPTLRKRMVVEGDDERPVERRLRPRLDLGLVVEPTGVRVLPRIAYGDPAIAHVIDGTLRGETGGGHKAVGIRRDEGLERELALRLRESLDLVLDRPTRFEGQDAARFVARLRSTHLGDGAPAPQEAPQSVPLTPILELDGERFDLRFVTSGDADEGGAVEPEAVLAAHRQGLSLVPLPGGGFGDVPSAWIEAHGATVAALLAARDEDKRVRGASGLLVMQLCEALDRPVPPSFDRLRPLLASGDSLPEPSLPDDLRASLRPYQRSGVTWLSFCRAAGLGAVLADDMGLGKTLQTLAVLRGRSLVVCPRSVIHNWRAEAERFRPAAKVAMYHGPRRALDSNADITLTTYATLRNDIEELAAVEWDAAVLDEAQMIKNPDSSSARAAYRLKAGFRLALSGTPVENRLDELWSLFHFTNPGLLGGRRDFGDRFEQRIAAGDAGAVTALRERTRPFLMRRLKRDVAKELPPRTDALLVCELDDAERQVYRDVLAATQREVAEALGQGKSALSILEALLRLRQAACHTGLLPGREAEGSSKVDQLLEALEDLVSAGHKALVFSQWTSLLDRVEPHLEKASIPFLRLDGSTKDRAAVVDGFQAEGGPPVLLLSLKAGGTGLNLTAADHVFLLDPWWNPAVEDQAADRAHRIGQDKPVLVYRMVAKDTVEERVVRLQEQKRAIADAAVGGEAVGQPITIEDLRSLLDDDVA